MERTLQGTHGSTLLVLSVTINSGGKPGKDHAPTWMASTFQSEQQQESELRGDSLKIFSAYSVI